MRVFKYLSFLLLFITLSFIPFVNSEEEDIAPAEETVDSEETEDVAVEAVEEEEGVLVLTDDNFLDVALTKDIILVEFYAPWCGHCKQLAPEYAKAAQTLKENDPPIPLAKLDATEHPATTQKYGVKGYPTLKVFRNGNVFDYEGPRVEEGIVKYMKEQADPNWKPPPEAVITLTMDNFDEVVNTTPLMLVEFYAPWCGHCKNLAPEFEKAAKQLKMNDPPIVLAKVDATVETELGKQFDVSGYPTLLIFRYGIESKYDGPREAKGIVEDMLKQSLPKSQELTTIKEVKDYIDYLDDLSVVGFFTNDKDPLYQLFIDTANAIKEEYRFGYTFLEEARKYYKVDASKIVLFHSKRFHSKHEPSQHIFDTKVYNATFDTLTAWFQAYDLPLVGQMMEHVYDRWFHGSALIVVYYIVDWSREYKADTEYWRQKVLEVASDPEFEDYTFAIADEDEFGKLLVELGLGESGNEINVGLYDQQKRKYVMDPDEEFSVEGLRDFLTEYKAGNLIKVVQSQPNPKDNSGPVKIVVGKTFEKMVLDESKDVLLEVYAPWCGHCKKLEPVYKKLGKKYKNKKDVVIAKIDGTQNDLPIEFATAGYPTIFYVKRGDLNDVVKFEETERTVKSLTKFIQDNLSVKSQKDEL